MKILLLLEVYSELVLDWDLNLVHQTVAEENVEVMDVQELVVLAVLELLVVMDNVYVNLIALVNNVDLMVVEDLADLVEADWNAFPINANANQTVMERTADLMAAVALVVLVLLMNHAVITESVNVFLTVPVKNVVPMDAEEVVERVEPMKLALLELV